MLSFLFGMAEDAPMKVVEITKTFYVKYSQKGIFNEC